MVDLIILFITLTLPYVPINGPKITNARSNLKTKVERISVKISNYIKLFILPFSAPLPSYLLITRVSALVRS